MSDVFQGTLFHIDMLNGEKRDLSPILSVKCLQVCVPQSMEALDPLMMSKLSLSKYSEPHIYIMCMEAVCPSVRSSVGCVSKTVRWIKVKFN